jgi:AraC-like DNA-binding protein
MTPFFHTLPPASALRGWVRHHQIIRFRFAPGQDAPIKPYWPRPACALAFYPRDPETLVDARGAGVMVKPRTALIGQPTVLTRRRGGADFCVYQIDFDATDWAAARLVAGEARSLQRLAQQAGLNVRTFHRTFRERMGVSPKLFARIARLDRMIRARNAAPETDWLSLAIEAGFYDHQHMARDFRDLCLSSPTAFYAGEQAAPERAFGIAEK